MFQGKLPKGVSLHLAPQRKFREVIVFSHHFAGRQHNLHRHIRFVTELGFNAVSFDFSWHGRKAPKSFFWLPDLKRGRMGLMHQWSVEVENILNSLAEPRSVILYSFSGPAASVIEAVARRVQRGEDDVKALIFDSGPFIDPWIANDNLLRLHYGIKNEIARKSILASMVVLWGANHKKAISADLEILDKEMPILSIRALEDKLVPCELIAGVFRGHGFRRLQVVELPGCDHLLGLKDFPEVYKPAVQSFLEKYATPL